MFAEFKLGVWQTTHGLCDARGILRPAAECALKGGANQMQDVLDELLRSRSLHSFFVFGQHRQVVIAEQCSQIAIQNLLRLVGELQTLYAL